MHPNQMHRNAQLHDAMHVASRDNVVTVQRIA
jgi:hypothetical protein